MTSSVVQVRVDTNLKNQAQEIYDALGLDLSSAIRMFLKKSVTEKGIPFETKVTEQKKVSLAEGRKAFYAARKHLQNINFPELSLDEINAIIKETRGGLK